MPKTIFATLFCFCAFGVFADVPEFEKPATGLKTLTIESYDKDDKDLTVERFTLKTVEKFDDRGDLVSRELSDADGKTEKLSYKHVYGTDGQIEERSELDADGKILRKWEYGKNDAGNLKVKLTVFEASENQVCIYQFDQKGRLDELVCESGKGSKTINHYDADDGALIEQLEFAAGNLSYRTEFEYDKKGKLRGRSRYNKMGYLSVEENFNSAGDPETRAVYDYYGDDIVEQSAHEYVYDDHGRITEDNWMNGQIEKHALVMHRGHSYYTYEFSEQKK